MAKGGLVGTADSTLVQGAFRLGRSNMPYNLGPVYQQRAANMKMFGEAVKGFMDNLYADHINTENNMNTLAESIQEGGGLTNTYMIEQNNAVVNEFKERLKSIPKGKKGELERQLLYQEMSDYAQSLNGSNEMYNNMVANAANKRLLSSYNSDEKELFNLIMDDHVNGTSNTQATYDRDKHEMVYSMQNKQGDTITMSMADINRGLAAYDPTYLNNIASKFTNVVNYAKQSKNGQMTTNDAIRLKNDLNKSITSWPEIRNVAKEKFGNMKHSFEEVLMGQATDAGGNIDTSLTNVLYNELEAAGGIDMDGNNIINEADRKIYTNPENAGLLIDALHKDKEKYKELMTGFLTETVVNDYYQQGVDQRPTPKGTGKNIDTNLNPFKPGSGERVDMGDGKTRYIPASVQNRRRKNIMDIVENDKNGAIFSGELGDYTWFSEEGRWKSGENLYTTFEVMNDERVYAAGNDFENGLGVSQQQQNQEALTPQQILQRTFSKEEEFGKLDLQKILPANYSFQEKGADAFGIDAVEIFDDNMNSLGVFGFDYSNPKKALERAEYFYKKFGPDGADILKMPTSGNKNYYDLITN